MKKIVNLTKVVMYLCITTLLAMPSMAHSQITPKYYYSNSNGDIALATFFSKGRSQNLIRSSDFLQNYSDTKIEKIYLKAYNSSNTTLYNFIIRIGTTNDSILTNAPWSNINLDTVLLKNSYNINTIANEWIEIPLDTTYNWDGTNNLIIDFETSNITGGFGTLYSAVGPPSYRHRYGGDNGGNTLVSNSPSIFIGIDACTNPLFNLGNDTNICEGKNLLLDVGINNIKYVWNTNDTTKTLNVNTAGTYYVTALNNSCTFADTIKITTIEAPHSNAIIIDAINPPTYNFKVSNPSANYNYHWAFSDGQQRNGSNVYLTFKTKGVNYLTLYASNFCGVDSVKAAVNVPLNIQDIESSDQIKIYPNPNNGIFHLDFPSNKIQIHQLNIINYLGEIIYTQNTFSNEPIDISQLADGIYFIHLETSQGKLKSKILLRK
jgi:hypothetical protein